MLDFLKLNLDGEAINVASAVKAGFAAWGLLIVALGIVFLSIVILSKVTGKKKNKKEGE